MIFSIIELIVSYIEIYLCFRFLDLIFTTKLQLKKKNIYIYTYSAIIALFVFLYNLSALYSSFLLLSVIICISYLALYVFIGKWLQMLTVVGIYYFVVTILDLFVIFLLSIITGNYKIGSLFITESNIYRCLYISAMKLILCLIYKIVKKRSIDWKIFVNYYQFWLTSVIIGYCALAYFQQFAINRVTEMLASNWMLFIVIVIMFTISFVTYSKYRDYKEIYGIMNMRNEVLKDSYNNLQHLIEENKHILHDVKNHTIIVTNYIKKNENKKALAYIESVTDSIKKIDDIVNSDIEIINIILNCKAAEAQKNNIKILYDIHVKKCNVDEKDFCSIISNLLDNAIEASIKAKEEERYIRLIMRSINSMLIIKIQNNIVEQPKTVNNKKFLTTKVSKQRHGIGLESVKYCVQKYNGNIKFDYGEDYFKVEIVLFRV